MNFNFCVGIHRAYNVEEQPIPQALYLLPTTNAEQRIVTTFLSNVQICRHVMMPIY